MEFGPSPASAGGLLPIDALATSGVERRHLGGGVVIVGGDSGVADLLCTNLSPIEPLMQYLFATREPQETREMRSRCKIARLRNTLNQWSAAEPIREEHIKDLRSLRIQQQQRRVCSGVLPLKLGW